MNLNKTFKLMAVALLLAGTAAAQDVVQVGKGSYASYTPYSICHSDFHTPGAYGFKGDQSKYMQYRPLYIHEREGQPLPTNDWWTDMLKDGQPYSGHLWSYPQYVQAQSYGIDVQAPSFWNGGGTDLLGNTVLKVAGVGFQPDCAIVQYWHDWDVAFSQTSGQQLMYTTLAHGMPFTWVELQGVDLQLSLAPTSNHQSTFTATTAEVLDGAGRTVTGTRQMSRLAMRLGDDAYGNVYGIYLPADAQVSVEGDKVSVAFHGSQRYVSVAVLHGVAELDAYATYAYQVPRSTEVSWQYDAAAGKLRTYWTVNTDDLSAGAQIPDFGSDNASPQPQPEPARKARALPTATGKPILQGFMPHQYRDTGNDGILPFNGLTYPTPHGKMRMAEGRSGEAFEVDYNFYGMLPYYARPTDTDRAQNPYNEEWMTRMLRNYADNGTFGADTYWGGKGLTQMALYMMFAREMGNEELFAQCRDRLKAALADWLTFTPGETSYFFARYDRWGAMVGYSTSYDSDTFNDHHFHYGYFTYAAALLALVDDDFRNNYGEMMTLIAKDYANWDRNDTRFPFFRTFDPWAGHSFAGGMGDGNGNGQESSSEAMQSWGGLYLLGVALDNKEMRDAGIFGWVTEARGTAEYWFDRHSDASVDWSNYHQHASDDYNIDYDRFRDDQGVPHPYNSNLTCQGVGWWTYFGYNSLYMSGIQWMPISHAPTTCRRIRTS